MKSKTWNEIMKAQDYSSFSVEDFNMVTIDGRVGCIIENKSSF